jgi:uncharacterized protein (DUF2252 family)
MPHLTPDERSARGKAARAEVPRSAHATWEPPSTRPDPVELLERQATTRVPELVPIRYGRMLVSPFTFYRGAAAVMASDLASTPRSGLRAQTCGDAHLANFGFFASPERDLVFDINDFDETLPGPWEWDVKRLAASLTIAGRENGYEEKMRRGIAAKAAGDYRIAMRTFAQMRNMDVWYARAEVGSILQRIQTQIDPKRLKLLEKAIDKMRTRDSMQAFAKLTQVVDGEPRIVGDPPLIVPVEDLVQGIARDELIERLRDIIRGYRRTLASDRSHLLEEFRFVHLARKVVGVGSVGTRAWIALMLGRDDQDPLFLQLKEAQPSVLEAHVGRSQYSNSGQRVVAGQRLMQGASDIFLGWQRVEGIDGKQRDFYVRQLRDWKGSLESSSMLPRGMGLYAGLCGWTLARAHARSGDRIAIASYLGNGTVFEDAIAEFAERYADQNEKDHAALVEAVASGRVVAQTGV